MEETKAIEFGRKELDPSKEEAYRKKIEEAKKSSGVISVDALKGHTPLGHTEKPNMPILANQSKRQSEPTGLTPEGGVAPRPPGSPAIRNSTAAELKAFAEATAKEAEAAKEKAQEEEDKEDSYYDEYDLGPKNEAQLVLANKKRRKEIESRCAEMAIEDLILKGEVRQVIPIVPNRFEVEFRSTLPEESLFVKKRIAEGKVVSDQHTLEQYGLLQLCCALVQINGEKFPNHLDENQSPVEELFNKKYAKMMRLSGYVINDLMVNLSWFDIRVRRLLNSEKLGNG